MVKSSRKMGKMNVSMCLPFLLVVALIGVFMMQCANKRENYNGVSSYTNLNNGKPVRVSRAMRLVSDGPWSQHTPKRKSVTRRTLQTMGLPVSGDDRTNYCDLKKALGNCSVNPLDCRSQCPDEFHKYYEQFGL